MKEINLLKQKQGKLITAVVHGSWFPITPVKNCLPAPVTHKNLPEYKKASSG